jgi:hypothetical protein
MRTIPNPTTPVVNVDFVVMRLTQGNGLTLREKPKQQAIRTADGGNRRMYNVHDKSEVSGSLMTDWWPEQTTVLFNWASVLTSGELGSCTVDHAIQDMSGTIRYFRYLGVKVKNLTVSSSADDTPFKLKFDLVGMSPAVITVTDFPAIAQSVYPATRPYVFTDLASPGVLSITSGRSEFAAVELQIANVIDAPFTETKYVQSVNFCGRDVSLVNRLKLKALTDRTNYAAVTPAATSVRVDNGTNHTIFTLNSQNFIDTLEDDLALDKVYWQTITLQNYYDPAAPGDFGYSYT